MEISSSLKTSFVALASTGQTIGVARRVKEAIPKFLAYLVVECCETPCPKRNTVARINSKYLPPPKFCAGYAAGR